MQTHIINPIFFYFMDVFCALNDIVAAVTIFSFFGIAVFAGIFLIDEMPAAREEWDVFFTVAKPAIICFVISAFIMVLTPSKETIYLMMAADMATYENLDAGVQAIKELFDYAASAMGDK